METRVTAEQLVAAVAPEVVIDEDQDGYDFLIDTMAQAAAMITAALQQVLDDAHDDEQTQLF